MSEKTRIKVQPVSGSLQALRNHHEDARGNQLISLLLMFVAD